MLAIHRDIDAGTYQRDQIHAHVFHQGARAMLNSAWRRALKQEVHDPFGSMGQRRG
jgi:hypothetical protein